MKLPKYKENLRIEGNKVYSYNTHVATIDDLSKTLYIHGYWSVTTSKHVNYVASEYYLNKLQINVSMEEFEKNPTKYLIITANKK